MIEALQRFREQGLTARGVTLDGVHARNLDLRGLRADQLTLRNTDLTAAQLSAVDWIDCLLFNVVLDQVQGAHAILRSCTLTDVRAAGSDLAGAKLENCIAPGITLDGVILVNGSVMDSDLSRASLRGAKLRALDASGAILRGADLRDTDARDANFEQADLRGVDFTGAQLQGARWDGADVRGSVGLNPNGGDESSDAFRRAQIDAAAPSTPAPSVAVDFPAWAAALSPALLNVLKRGVQGQVLSSDEYARLSQDMQALGVNSEPSSTTTGFDTLVNQVLARAGSVGVDGLMSALLRSPQDGPPAAVAEMIRGLMDDAQLGATATADDLLQHLLRQVSQTKTGQ